MTTDPAAGGWLLFDAVEIDLGGHRLFIGGTQVALEPKAVAVLVLLAGRPGHAFTRDEILDTVWSHRHVTPGVLNRVIALLRHALGDGPDAPRYLHTLHAVGYRFDAAVTRAASRMPAAVAVPITETTGPEASAAARRVEPHAAPTTTRETGLPRAAPSRSSRLSRARPWLLGFALVAAATGWYLARRAEPYGPALSPAPLLVVLPLHAVDESAGERALADGLSEELITRLARIEGLHLISSTSSALAQSGKLDLAQLAERLHVTHALEGSLRQSGAQLRVDLRLVETPSGRALWAQGFDRGLTDIFSLQHDIAQAVAASLRLSMGLAAGHEPAGDAERYREYLALRSQFRMPDRDRACGEALPSLRAIVAAAPDYAPTHGLLARALTSNTCLGKYARPHDHDEGRREAERALQLDPGTADAHAALANLACRDTRWTACLSEMRMMLERDPADAQTRVQQAYWLVGLGYVKEGLTEAEAGWFSDPLNYFTNFARGRVLDTLGRHDEARRYFDAMPALDAAGARLVIYSRWFNAVWRTDLVGARAFAEQIPEQDGFRESYRAATDALVDPLRWPEAVRVLDASEARSGRFDFVRLLQPGYDPAKAIEGLEKILRTGISSYSMMIWQPEYISLRRDPAFQDFLKRAHIIDYWRSNGWPAQCRPDGDGARCD